MKTIKYKNAIVIYNLLFLFILASCDSFLEEKDIPRLTPEYYGTQAGVESAATATYSYMRWGAGNLERYNSLTEYGTDLFTQAEDPGLWASAFNQYGSQLNPDATILYDLWSNHYKAISTANLVIQQVEASLSMTVMQKRLAIAEMSFLLYGVNYR